MKTQIEQQGFSYHEGYVAGLARAIELVGQIDKELQRKAIEIINEDILVVKKIISREKEWDK